MNKRKSTCAALFLALSLLLTACSVEITTLPQDSEAATSSAENDKDIIASVEDVPKYSGDPYVVINNNEPSFPDKDMTKKSFETYSKLDDLGRCGVAYANVGVDLMPTQKRGDIYMVRPTGWHSVQYDFVEGKNLYNRCHLIGYQLTAENANERNLITGTRYLNTKGMLPFENLVADYVKETRNHVLYRVTPIFKGNNLVASGVQMEAKSVEDNGEGVLFNVYAYNVQPGVTIQYSTGDSKLAKKSSSSNSSNKKTTYVLNTKSHKFHVPSCSSITEAKQDNLKNYTGTRKKLIEQGYEPCNRCKP